MSKLPQGLIIITQQIYLLLWQRRSGKMRGLLILIFLSLTVRLIPYLAPITEKDIQQNEQAIEFSDRNGLPLGTILTRDQNHTSVITLDQVSPIFIKAILATEDAEFYHHGALDFKAIIRSIYQAIESKKVISGASTITMQLARMLEPSSRTLPAKFKEIWLSWRLTAGMDKNAILQAYINRLPMGSNIYGLEAASRIYFGISAKDLNLAQASILAAIPNNPTYLNPYIGWEYLKRRQKYVLKRMTKEGYITTNQAREAYQEKIPLQSRQQGIIAAPHFLFWVTSQLPVNHPSQIQTTIDLPLQKFVETQAKEVIRSLKSHNVHQAAALVIDNHTGEILAYVGSTDYFGVDELGNNDGVQALRQPGSTLKPFLYQLALEKRLIHGNTVLADVPTHYAIPGAKLYSPSDYSETFSGPVRIRVALANSLNVPAVRVLEKVGVENFLTRLQKLGFEHLNQSPEYYGLGLTLGSGEVSLWELARAYRIMAQKGTQNLDLQTITNQPQPTNFKLSKDTSSWSLVTDMLSDRHARAKAFGVNSILNLPFPSAVKTGTSSNFRDTWTIGFTSDYTVATWVGNFDGQPMRQVSGVMGAAPLWNRILLHLHEQKTPQPFDLPVGMIKRPICALSGLKPTPYCPSIVQEYFYPQDLSDYENKPDIFYQSTSDNNNSSSDLNLPSEYNEWLAKQPLSDLMPTNLRILSPRNGDVFLLDSDKNHQQKLEFQLGGKINEPVELWLNNQKIATNVSNSFFWELQEGSWILEIRKDKIVDQVKFQVQLTKSRSNPKGFSIPKTSEKK
ncbi:multimodular transpeptidase-transglycosylase [Geminocystis sp. NIES-3708]|uniref:penicillin-binding protein 1C n=1 Tax=Geminocystis sp. NIES-3708 TaxID=1615909 RepID=UPI0005FC8ED8|nr:penicillin-binding protein 1C [Geminocystis sp. NIES-3708]BAQ59791.1 multimodular transpeptidase-transglycosylase [Geminocystis sp. NIES-3708]